MRARLGEVLKNQIAADQRPECGADGVKTLREIQAWVATRVGKSEPMQGAANALIRDRRREVILEVIADGQDPEAYFGSEFDRLCQEADWTAEQVRQRAEQRR